MITLEGHGLNNSGNILQKGFLFLVLFYFIFVFLKSWRPFEILFHFFLIFSLNRCVPFNI